MIQTTFDAATDNIFITIQASDGIDIDSKLCFDMHVSLISTKATRQLDSLQSF